ncbi:hypothetical protein [uncultured Amnibacterium sp.]|uniref:hypothetical protein n=1 Tax=uncultured Amnibacterium sp. TaxID=1631851 RepID=UPI0035CB6F9F
MTNATYIPGVCNIGPAEIQRRRNGGIGAAVATGAVLAATVLTGAPKPLRLIAILPAAGAATGFIQAATHFCAGFGMRGVFNVGDTGGTDTVEQAEFRAEDQAKAKRIIAASLAIGAGVGGAALLLP